MSFALKLKEQREKHNLSQAALAEKLHVGVGSVGMWESTDRIPPAKKLIKIADFFDVTVDYLLDRKNNTSPQQLSYTNREEELLTMFRQMDTAQQNRFLGIAEGMIEEATKFKKQ